MNLSSLRCGELAAVTGLPADQALSQRLSAMGVALGKTVRLVRRAALGGPLQLRVGNTEFFLRQRDAAAIEVSRSG
ncbi:MAG: FeoA family protein [Halothiobacillaceae bacterium]|jgi:ferrous iron transport protein A|nr:FeoA family protein [Halothiobacillaceae bacterium]MDY0049613.1 FeoA family protein [Halothiobacillaceae bacterium]